MKLTERDIELFKALNKSDTGKYLLEYVERVKLEIGNILNLTPENFASKKEAIKALDEFLVQRIKTINEDKKPNNNPYV